jgi:peroxiredoxin Q/BCP
MTTRKKKGSAKKAGKKTAAKKPAAKKARGATTKKPAAKKAKKPGRAGLGKRPIAKTAARAAATSAVQVGGRAPDFTLASDQGGDVTLSSLRGKKVVLYFYPKDDTPGCTIQACDFRDAAPSFAGVDAVVLGVSADSVESHRKFRDKFGLNFPLLADERHEVADAYGVWQERSMYGRTFMGIERSTFLIDEKGVVAAAWRKVSPKGHADMLAELLGAV